MVYNEYVIDILNYFPKGYTPSKHQEKILKRVDKAFFDDNHKFVVINAPTGSGKSFLAKTLGNASKEPNSTWNELINSYAAYTYVNGEFTNAEICKEQQPFGSFVLTTTKSLQDQYTRQFEDLSMIKGKSNYPCDIDDQFSVDVAPCVHMPTMKKGCWESNRCMYYNARNDALTSQLAALNYDMFLALPDHLKYRDFIICDEASELEEQIVKHFSCTFNIQVLKRCNVYLAPLPKNYAALGRWVSSIALQLKDECDDIKKKLSQMAKPTENKKKLSKKFQFLLSLYSDAKLVTETWSECEYIQESDGKVITFKPLKVDKLSGCLFDYGKKVVLMSATIIDHTNFCKTLGIDDYEYIEIDSPFDPKNAPIYTSNKHRLSYKNLQTCLPKITQQIEDICEMHKGEKGIIHTHTNMITKHMHNNLYGDRFLFREPGIDNESLMRDHMMTDTDTVLVSPSMTFGVDLKDDLARFQIIVKAPYLPLNDERIKRMMQLDKDWYMNKMLVSLIQSCGRGVRSSNDHCTTYILDGMITDCILKNKSRLPKYFIERFA